MKDERPHIYGPVPSRRLGASLGVDLVPPKTCNFDCIYCQLGRTSNKTVHIGPYVEANIVLAELKKKLESGVKIDCITMAGSGEPTLNSELGQIISQVKRISEIPVVIITNGALFSDPDVRRACLEADMVLPSLNAGSEEEFLAINRPCPEHNLIDVVDGLTDFRKEYRGNIRLEIMLLEGLNSSDESIKRIGKLVERINPDDVHLNTVNRPPAELFAEPVNPKRLQEIASALQSQATIVLEEKARRMNGDRTGSVDRNELLELIRRRPCTRAQVAGAFGINEIEALKLLSQLREDNKIISERSGEELFFRVVEPEND